jgi:hypothetical protein
MPESWHSLDEMHWFEAEAVVAEDIRKAEMEADSSGCATPNEVPDEVSAAKPRARLEGVALRDVAAETN